MNIENDLAAFVGMEIPFELHIFHPLMIGVRMLLKHHLRVRFIEGFHQDQQFGSAALQLFNVEVVQRRLLVDDMYQCPGEREVTHKIRFQRNVVILAHHVSVLTVAVRNG